MSFFARILGGRPDRSRLMPLYNAIVAVARDPSWYREGGVPDTIDGRFDLVAAVLALVLIRMEREEDRHTRQSSALLTEIFVDDMDGSLRQIGIGDLIVGKHMGRMMGALGGRLGAFRTAGDDEGEMAGAVRRNVFHEAPPSDSAVALVTERLLRFRARLEASAMPTLLAGEVPSL